ncbi:putative heavy metal-associated domain superfamily [Helianthus annuus]|nr:putative heavy metal-associated domain superfamily [Helianthus annuus]KAJ0933700.1 putative heavy metal-associated domain superfamily [Helianthus annuus]
MYTPLFLFFVIPVILFAFNVTSISKFLFLFLFIFIFIFFQKWKVTLGVNFNSESEIKKIEKTVSSVPGVESVSNDKEIGRLIVIGRFDHQAVVTCVREFEKMVQVLERRIIQK